MRLSNLLMLPLESNLLVTALAYICTAATNKHSTRCTCARTLQVSNLKTQEPRTHCLTCLHLRSRLGLERMDHICRPASNIWNPRRSCQRPHSAGPWPVPPVAVRSSEPDSSTYTNSISHNVSVTVENCCRMQFWKDKESMKQWAKMPGTRLA